MTVHLGSLQDKEHPSQKSDIDKALQKYVHQPAVILQVIASDYTDTEDSVIFEHKCQARCRDKVWFHVFSLNPTF